MSDRSSAPMPSSYAPSDVWYDPGRPQGSFAFSPHFPAAAPPPNASAAFSQLPTGNTIFNESLRYAYAVRDSLPPGASVAPSWPHFPFSGDAHGAGFQAPRQPAIDPRLFNPEAQSQSLEPTAQQQSLPRPSKRKQAPNGTSSSKAKRPRKTRAGPASSQADENAPPVAAAAEATAPSEPLISIVRAKAGHVERKDGASDVWWAMIPIKTTARSNDELTTLTGREGPSQEERSIPPSRTKPSPQDVPRVACRYCSKWASWATHGSVTSTIRDHLLEHHFKTSSGNSGPWREDIIKHSLKGYESLTELGSDESGTNLKPLDQARPMSYPEGSFTLDGFVQRLVRWIIVDDQSVNVVETPELRDLLLYLHAGLQDKDIPKRSKLTKVIFQRFLMEYEALITDMKEAQGRISFTSDCWTDPFLRAFMAITAHYCAMNSKGRLVVKNRLIAFRYLPGSHTGQNMAETFLSVLTEVGIEDKIGLITLDNASNNKTMMEALEDLLGERNIPFDRVQNRGRCFPHVVNIAVQTALKMLSTSAPEPDVIHEGDLPEAVQPLDVDAERLEDEPYVAALQSDPVARCRQLVANCRKSSQRRQDFIATIEDGNKSGQWKLPSNQLLRDVDTRWSSTFLMIDRVLELYQAIDVFLDKNKQSSISASRLSPAELEVLDDIRFFLSIPHVVQQMLSSEKTPTLSNVLPAYAELVQSLRELETCERYIYIKPAISAAISKIEAYTASTRATRAYVLAMAINPLCKFEVLRGTWGEGEVENAKEWVREAMLEHRMAQRHASAAVPGVSPLGTGMQAPNSSSRASSSLPSLQAPTNVSNIAFGLSKLREQTVSALARASNRGPSEFRSRGDTINLSPPCPDTPTSNATSLLPDGRTAEPDSELTRKQAAEEDRLIVDLELQRWCSAGLIAEDSPVRQNFDLIRWWQNKGEEKEYPYLYRVALDIMPMQASAVPCERVFSSSKHTASLIRSQISPQFMEICQILKYLFKQQRLDSTGDTLGFSLSDRLNDLYDQLFAGEAP